MEAEDPGGRQGVSRRSWSGWFLAVCWTLALLSFSGFAGGVGGTFEAAGRLGWTTTLVSVQTLAEALLGGAGAMFFVAGAFLWRSRWRTGGVVALVGVLFLVWFYLLAAAIWRQHFS
jgi:hypothetical protein